MTPIKVVFCCTASALAVAFSSLTAHAQQRTGGFVMTLGADTVQVEEFTRSGRDIAGVLVTRTPVTRILRYHLTLGTDGRIARYEQSQLNGDGTPLLPDPARAVMEYGGDTVVRTALQRDGTPVTQRIATPDDAFPVGTIPIGASFLIFELALQRARAAPPSSAPTLNRLLPLASMGQPMRTAVLHRTPDSVEVDYFGQGRIGFRFDGEGRLLRSDWRNTTYRVLVNRDERLNANEVARGWAAQDAAGVGAGPLSPRDSAIVTVGNATLAVYYARPAKRGRDIWRDVVPSNAVWRLGADLATRFTTSADLVIGDSTIPAGEYTLWMWPSPQAPLLIVSGLVKVFGTQYNPAKDIARIPLQREALAKPVERLTLSWTPNAFRIAWDNAAFVVPVRVK